MLSENTPSVVEYTWRPMRPDDAAGLARLLAAAEEIDRTGELVTEADLHEELTDPALDLDVDSVAVVEHDELVAYQISLVRPEVTGVGRAVGSRAVVHPRSRGRGIGTALVRRGLERAVDADARFLARVVDADAAAAAVFAAQGLRPVRWWSQMARDLAEPVAPVGVPEGVGLHPLGPDYDAARWDEPLRAAHNAAFAGHWGSSAVGADAWRYQRTGTGAFRPACSVAATHPDAGPGAVVAYVLSYEFPAPDGRPELLVATVGTRAQWRGRGLAAALLTHVLAAAVAAGFPTSSLTVDAENATGALGVYERVGFAAERRFVTYSG